MTCAGRVFHTETPPQDGLLKVVSLVPLYPVTMIQYVDSTISNVSIHVVVGVITTPGAEVVIQLGLVLLAEPGTSWRCP